MTLPLTRRDFLAVSGALGAGLLTTPDIASAATYRTKLRKSLIGKPDEKVLREWKAAGIEGIESNDKAVSVEQAAQSRQMAEKLGMPIHCLLRGWMNFNSPDPAVVDKEIAELTDTLRSVAAYGAGAMLLVPCKVGGRPLAPSPDMPMPMPWEFDIEFDEKTCHVKRVVRGDNSPYQKYIEAQNFATDSSRAAVRRLIPVAEKCRVVIALENVWNNLWVKPALARAFLASFDCPWVQFYFDIGNHLIYAPSEEWIRTMGKLIARCHVKDFKLAKDGEGKTLGGQFVDIREGDVNWPAVRQALEDIGYNGWMTIEGSGRLALEEKSKRLDLIFAGR